MRAKFIIAIDYKADMGSMQSNMESMALEFNEMYGGRLVENHNVTLMEQDRRCGLWEFGASCESYETQTIKEYAETCARKHGFMAGGKAPLSSIKREVQKTKSTAPSSKPHAEKQERDRNHPSSQPKKKWWQFWN